MILALVCFAFLSLYWDLRMKFSYYVEGSRLHPERFDRLQSRGFVSLMSVLRVYAGLRVEVEKDVAGGLPSQFMILSNHQSLLDIPVLAWVFRRRCVGFVAKAELKQGLPGFSFVLRKGRHALVPRHGDFREAHRQLLRMAEELRGDVCPIVFPEGTRSRNGEVQAFHSAAVRTILARRPMPVLTVALEGGRAVARLKDIVRNLGRCVYQVKFLSLHPTAVDRFRVQQLISGSHEQIKAQVETWRGMQK